MRAADPVEQGVKSIGCNALEREGCLTLDALGLNDIITLPDEIDHLGQHFRWMLAIRIHRDDHIAIGMIAWMGYKSVILPYHEPKRVAGKSKYSLSKMLRLASDAIFSFSLMPLYIGLSVGGLFLVLALAQIVYVLLLWSTGQYDRIVPGWSSLMAVMLIASGIIMILLGFIGVYVGYIFQQVKGRPVYLLKSKRGPDA